jgi:hypothetical protein
MLIKVLECWTWTAITERKREGTCFDIPKKLSHFFIFEKNTSKPEKKSKHSSKRKRKIKKRFFTFAFVLLPVC